MSGTKCHALNLCMKVVVNNWAWVTHGMENDRCQVDCMRCYTPKPNQFWEIEEKKKKRGKKRKKERKEEKEEKKGRKNHQFSGSLTAQGLSSELVCASSGRSFLLLWLFLSKGHSMVMGIHP